LCRCSVYKRFSPELKLLYRHLAEGEEDYLQPANQILAAQARIQRPPERGDNSAIKVGEVGMDEWRVSTGNELAKL
jgi:hypothetical protein